LITFRDLDDKFGFAVDSKHDGPARQLHLVQEVAGAPLEVGEGLVSWLRFTMAAS
jgi:hypothetical protein